LAEFRQRTGGRGSLSAAQLLEEARAKEPGGWPDRTRPTDRGARG
jgi:hypothetical protein